QPVLLRLLSLCLLLLMRGRPGSTLFPYTTLFRSRVLHVPQELGPLQGLLSPGHLGREAGLLQLDAALPQRPDELGVAHLASGGRSEEHTSELQSREKLVCRLLLEKKTIH